MNFNKIIKKDQLLELINDINMNKRYTKFFYDDETQNIISSQAIPTTSFSLEEIVIMSMGMLETTIEVYPKFMKLQWG